MAEVCWLFQGCRADVNFRSDICRHLRLKQSGSGVQCMCSLHSFADLLMCNIRLVIVWDGTASLQTPCWNHDS